VRDPLMCVNVGGGCHQRSSLSGVSRPGDGLILVNDVAVRTIGTRIAHRIV
jgi:hypothetical protein